MMSNSMSARHHNENMRSLKIQQRQLIISPFASLNPNNASSRNGKITIIFFSISFFLFNIILTSYSTVHGACNCSNSTRRNS